MLTVFLHSASIMDTVFVAHGVKELVSPFQDDRPTRRYHRLPPGQETSGQEPTEAAEGSTEDEKFKRGGI